MNTTSPPEQPVKTTIATNQTKSLQSLCVFCGSQTGNNPHHSKVAETLAQHLVERNIRLVFGGGSVGMMGVVANTMLQAGGKVVGVTVESLIDMEQANTNLERLIITKTLEERKTHMHQLADAFLTLPGGLGTLDELFGVLTGQAIRLHQKPIALLDVAGYYTPLWAFLEHAREQGFVKPKHLALVARFANPAQALDHLSQCLAQPNLAR